MAATSTVRAPTGFLFTFVVKHKKVHILCFNSFLCLLLLCRDVHNASDDTLMIDKCIKQMDWQIVFPGILFYDSDIWS